MNTVERSIESGALESAPRIATLVDEETLSDEELIEHVGGMATTAREVLVATIRALTEIERRGLHLKLGCASLYKFCLFRLGMSEDQAYRHVNAMRLSQRYPAILPMLESGELHLAALSMVKKHLNTADDDWLIHAVAGKSKREVQKTLALYFPNHVPGPMQRIELLNGELARLEVVIERSTLEMLETAAAMMAHQHPAQTLGVVIREAAKLLMSKLKASRFGQSERPHKKPRKASADHVTRAARRETFSAADHRCTFVSEEGIRCDGEAFLEIDHITPRANDGSSDATNLRVLCRAHNEYEARRILGDDIIHIARARRDRERERAQKLLEEREEEEEQCRGERRQVEHGGQEEEECSSERHEEEHEDYEQEGVEELEKAEQRENTDHGNEVHGKEVHENAVHETTAHENTGRETTAHENAAQLEHPKAEHEKEGREKKEATRRDGVKKLEYALSSMGFRIAKVRAAVNRFAETHPDDDLTELAPPLRELLQTLRA